MIEVQNLTKYYGSVAAIQGVSFEVGKGEILGFLGPNGAGKTTTMRILTGYFPATSGTAKIAGFDVFNQLNEVRKRTGYVPENVPLYSDMPVRAYLNFAAQIKGMGGKECKKAVDKVISDVGLTAVEKRLIKKLSKGYRQRVGLAQALVNNPSVLILDEPTVGLDPKQIHEIRTLIRGLAGERTVILSTHILPEVSMTCQKVVIIHQGKIVAADTLENLTNRDREDIDLLVTFRGDVHKTESGIREISGVHSVRKETTLSDGAVVCQVSLKKDPDLRGKVAKAITDSGVELLELKTRETTLEEVFIRCITQEESQASESEEGESK